MAHDEQIPLETPSTYPHTSYTMRGLLTPSTYLHGSFAMPNVGYLPQASTFAAPLSHTQLPSTEQQTLPPCPFSLGLGWDSITIPNQPTSEKLEPSQLPFHPTSLCWNAPIPDLDQPPSNNPNFYGSSSIPPSVVTHLDQESKSTLMHAVRDHNVLPDLTSGLPVPFFDPRFGSPDLGSSLPPTVIAPPVSPATRSLATTTQPASPSARPFVFGASSSPAWSRPFDIPVAVEPSGQRRGPDIDSVLALLDDLQSLSAAEKVIVALMLVLAVGETDEQVAAYKGFAHTLLDSAPAAKALLVDAQQYLEHGMPLPTAQVLVGRALESAELVALVRQVHAPPVHTPYTRQIRSNPRSSNILAIKASVCDIRIQADTRSLDALCKAELGKSAVDATDTEKLELCHRCRTFTPVDPATGVDPLLETLELDSRHFPTPYSGVDTGSLKQVDLCSVATRTEAFKCYIFHNFPTGECSCGFRFYYREYERHEGESHPLQPDKDPFKKPVEMRRHLVDYPHNVTDHGVLVRISQIWLDWEKERLELRNADSGGTADATMKSRKRPRKKSSGSYLSNPNKRNKSSFACPGSSSGTYTPLLFAGASLL